MCIVHESRMTYTAGMEQRVKSQLNNYGPLFDVGFFIRSFFLSFHFATVKRMQ